MAFVVQAKEWGLDRVDRVLQGRAQACARFPRLRRQGKLRHLPTALNSSTSPPLGARVLPFFACYMRGIRPAWFTHNLQTRSPRMPIGCGDVNPPQESLYAQVRKTTRSAVPRVNHSSFTSFRLGGRLFFWCFTSVACLVKRVRVKNH
jgi:hypothetical protein